MKPGDMVVLVKIEKGSQAYEWGARLGHIGTIVMVGGLIAENGQYYDCAVRFDSIRDPRCLAACFYSSLRRIDPPERGSWDDCVWRPSRELVA